jgi:benzoyl-CoA reductase/2-hydroxyglutaryl-CoA dehydratase subunit BcrC/BadD/HgdB
MSVRYFFIAFFLGSTVTAMSQKNGPDRSQWGINDTIRVPTVFYDNEWMPYGEMEMVYVSNVSRKKMNKIVQEYDRLRNAVYVTYHYARSAGLIINDVNAHLKNISSKKERKDYIKSREEELKKQFTEPLSNLSVYQGKVLMKLINRQTGNDCFELIKEYRGGVNARMYQTLAFVFGSSLKQHYDAENDNTDRQIENIVKEIDGIWYNNPYRPSVPTAKSH